MKEGLIKVLVADDDSIVRTAVSRILEMSGYQVETVINGMGVMDVVDETYDVIILDINMPGMDGFQTINELNRLAFDIPVLFLTGAGSMDYAVKAVNLGAYDFITKPIDDLSIFNVKIQRAVEKRRFVKREKQYKAALEEDVQVKAKQLEEQNKLLRAYSNSLENATVQLMSSLQNALEEKDYYTAGHTVRVTDYALTLGSAMGLSESDMRVLRRAAQFHDIGKLVIDLSCIQKPGKLTAEEWILIRKHPTIGANIVEPLGFMKREQNIIRNHHERLDGKGYPAGIFGDELDSLTRIISVVDSYDAMTSSRNYRKNKTMEEALDELYRCRGTRFDPDIVDFFTRAIVDFKPMARELAEEPLESYFENEVSLIYPW